MTAPEKNEIAAAECADAEIELNERDLAALADSIAIKKTAPADVTPAVAAAAATAFQNPKTLKRADTSTARTISRTALVSGILFASIATGVVAYTQAYVSTGKTPQFGWNPAFPKPEPHIEESSEPAPQAPPVLYTNPFDKSEVFEFPAGTTKSAARDAVAEMLLQRAAERQMTAR